jgi:REP element-mobilizing transposase RayT
MARRNRDLVAGGTYHVWARGVRRLPIFGSDDDRQQYLLELAMVVEDLGWLVLAYCLMRNHVHLLVETPKPDLSDGMRVAHGNYARYVNRAFGEVGHAFDDRYGSERLKSSGDVMYVASYIALNPVRAGICELPEHYAWSSHAAVMGQAPRPRWLAPARLLGHFAGEKSVAAADRYAGVVDAIRVMGVAGFEPSAVLRSTQELGKEA